MQHDRRGGAAGAVIAAVLLLVGCAAMGLWRVLSGTEAQPFAQGATPPSSAQVTIARTYSLAVPGGVRAMLARGVPRTGGSSAQLISLQCSWSSPGARGQTLSVSAESITTKAENTVGHFVAPLSGRIHVDCDGWGAMFIPDSDDAPADASGWALWIAIVTLTAGGAVALSVARTARGSSRGAHAVDRSAEGSVGGRHAYRGTAGAADPAER